MAITALTAGSPSGPATLTAPATSVTFANLPRQSADHTALYYSVRERTPDGYLLGALTGLALHAAWLWMLGAGLLGGYTTFSTVAVETWLLAEAGARRAAWGNALGSLLACVTAAGAGVLLGAWIAGALA